MARRIGRYASSPRGALILAVCLMTPGNQAKADDDPPAAEAQENASPKKDEEPETAEPSSLEEEVKSLKERLEELEQRVERQALEAPQEKDQDPFSIRMRWRGTLVFETLNKTIQIKLGGRIHAQLYYLNGDTKVERRTGDLEDGAEIRRARISISGLLYKHIEFKTQYEFSGGDGDVDFTDIFAGLKNIPYLGTIRFGQQKEPFGLEITESSNNFPFIERALPNNALQVIRNTGLRILNNYGNRLSWSAGVYRDTDSFGRTAGEGEFHLTGRVTGTPWFEDDGRMLLHIGASYSRRSPDDNQERYRTNPETNFAPPFVDTGTFAAKAIDVFGAETALVLGPVSFQAEYLYSRVDAPGGFRQQYHGYYFYATWFITGEHRRYKGSEGFFDTVPVKKPFLQDGGWGAFEIGARYSYLDLDTRRTKGGRLNDVTFALNWYPITGTRLMLNYVFANLNSVGEADLVSLRFQVVF